ncbi:MAG: MaoC family dehydratase N-terminal domain-containing protein [Deltaproteobacteria bacterium]|nr:MaoC family dehydratase N-terminal domain-containing protein [Deltaproteobacteria bacterium]
MALNPAVIGKKSESEPFTYDKDSVILYALGIGAGVENELDFLYEKDLKVFPTFAVIPWTSGFAQILAAVNLNVKKVLHGEQTIILHKEIPPEGTIYLTAHIDSIYDKGDKGAHVNLVFEARDEAGELIYENISLIVDRSGGNFGGDSGPKKDKTIPPDGQAPDFKVTYATSPDQAALYRLSGDKNLIHIDPEFAAMGGHKAPILHGLCTYGFCARAILHSVCNGDPVRLKYFSARMVKTVSPGDTLTTCGWKSGGNKYIIETTNQDGEVVLGNAIAEVVE